MSQAFSGKIQMSPPQCLPWRWPAKQMVILQVPPTRAFQAASSHRRVNSQQDVPSPPATPQSLSHATLQGGGWAGSQAEMPAAAGQPACQEPALGYPMTRSLQLCAHARPTEECDPDGRLHPHQVAQLGLLRIVQEQGGLATLSASQAGTNLMNENI